MGELDRLRGIEGKILQGPPFNLDLIGEVLFQDNWIMPSGSLVK